jgi:AcrR family transcriptional regulator
VLSQASGGSVNETVDDIYGKVCDARSYGQGVSERAKTTAAAPAEEGGQALPPGLDLLWAQRRPGRRGPKPGLSVDAVVDAAISVADHQGLEAVTMARVAEQLGVTTMALYRYVHNKDELLQLMWNASANGAEGLALAGETWREKLMDWALHQREALDRHPWINQLPMAAPPLGPSSAAFIERGLEAFDGTGLADHEKLGVIGLLSSYTLSEARMAHDATRAASTRTGNNAVPPPSPSFDAILRRVLNEEAFPRLFRIVWSTPPSSPGPDDRAQYLFGLDCILDGVQAMIDRPDDGRPRRG